MIATDSLDCEQATVRRAGFEFFLFYINNVRAYKRWKLPTDFFSSRVIPYFNIIIRVPWKKKEEETHADKI